MTKQNDNGAHFKSCALVGTIFTFVVAKGDDVRRAQDVSYVIIESCVCGL